MGKFMPQADSKRVVVSFDDEPLVLVNANDEIVGFQDKASCHDGQGTLHRKPYRFTPWFELEWQRLCRDFEHKLFAQVGQQN